VEGLHAHAITHAYIHKTLVTRFLDKQVVQKRREEKRREEKRREEKRREEKRRRGEEMKRRREERMSNCSNTTLSPHVIYRRSNCLRTDFACFILFQMPASTQARIFSGCTSTDQCRSIPVTSNTCLQHLDS